MIITAEGKKLFQVIERFYYLFATTCNEVAGPVTMSEYFDVGLRRVI